MLCGERVSDFTAYVCVKRDGKGAKEDEEGFIKCYSVLLQYSHYLLSEEQMRGNSLQSPTKSVLAKSNPNRVRSPPHFLLATFRLFMSLHPNPHSCMQAFLVGRCNLFTAKHQLAGKLTTNT